MSVDVIDLREFYSTPMGKVVQSQLVKAFRKSGELPENLDLVGIGYPVPLFEQLASNNPNAVILMPARQGALQWPIGAAVKGGSGG